MKIVGFFAIAQFFCLYTSIGRFKESGFEQRHVFFWTKMHTMYLRTYCSVDHRYTTAFYIQVPKYYVCASFVSCLTTSYLHFFHVFPCFQCSKGTFQAYITYLYNTFEYLQKCTEQVCILYIQYRYASLGMHSTRIFSRQRCLFLTYSCVICTTNNSSKVVLYKT